MVFLSYLVKLIDLYSKPRKTLPSQSRVKQGQKLNEQEKSGIMEPAEKKFS